MTKVDIPKFSNPPQTQDLGTLLIYIKELANQVALLSKALDFVVNDGNLDKDNIHANAITTDKLVAGSVTADKITVSELSAISANIGEVTAGIIRGIEIYGSKIATREAGYPVAYMSNTEDLFGVATASGESVTMEEGITGQPNIIYRSGGDVVGFTGMAFGMMGMRFSVPVYIGTTSGGIQLDGPVTVSSWNDLINTSTGQTLQQALEDKSNVGHTHDVTVPNHNHGNTANVTSGGGTFTTSS